MLRFPRSSLAVEVVEGSRSRGCAPFFPSRPCFPRAAHGSSAAVFPLSDRGEVFFFFFFFFLFFFFFFFFFSFFFFFFFFYFFFFS